MLEVVELVEMLVLHGSMLGRCDGVKVKAGGKLGKRWRSLSFFFAGCPRAVEFPGALRGLRCLERLRVQIVVGRGTIERAMHLV